MATPLALRVVEAEARVYRRVWKGSVVTSFLNPVLYLLAMGVGLGSLVDRNLPDGVAGVGYLAILAPGLLAATAMQTGAAEGAWKVMAGFKWRKTYQAVLATPVTIEALVLGVLTWAGVRVLMVTMVFAAVVVVFGVTSPVGALAAVLPAMLVGLATAAPVAGFTIRVDHDAGLTNLFRFGIVPMFLFSGTFFPVSQLPELLRPVAFAVPLFHGVEMARWAALGLAPAVSPVASVAYLLAWTVGGTWWAIRGFRRRLWR